MKSTQKVNWNIVFFHSIEVSAFTLQPNCPWFATSRKHKPNFVWLGNKPAYNSCWSQSWINERTASGIKNLCQTKYVDPSAVGNKGSAKNCKGKVLYY